MTDPMLSLKGLSRRFAGRAVVDDLSFDLRAGEILALIGASGCGKTTTLRMIAGFERPDAGRVLLAGRDITDLPPERRGIGILFQDYALFPHMTLHDNVAYGARGADVPGLLSMLGLGGLEGRFPDQLSGGQQQRAALARSLAADPRILLLDEPFSGLDPDQRVATRREVRRVLKAAGQGVVLVTHDPAEAMGFADRIAVMRAGRVHQIGPAREVYERPADVVAALALGRANLLWGRAEGLRAETVVGPCTLVSPASGEVLLALRPHDIALTPEIAADQSPGQSSGQVSGRVLACEYQGGVTICRIDCAGAEIEAIWPHRLAVPERVGVSVAPGIVLAVLDAAAGTGR